MDEQHATQWEPADDSAQETQDTQQEVKEDMAEEKQERKSPAKKAKDDKPATKKTPTAKRPERKAVWVCKECGMSWPRSRLSCNTCGGPTGRFYGTAEELAAYVDRAKARRRKGIINS